MVSRRHHAPRGWFICCPLILILFAACSTNASTSSTVSKGASPVPPAATAAAVAPLDASDCQPPSPLHAAPPQGLPEAQGTASGVQLWALFFTEMPVHSRQEIKIVWRMTGAGNVQLGAVGPAGRRISPDWIQAHEGSNWQRPGQEWGSGFTFPVAGCWDLHATRGASSGDVWLVVESRTHISLPDAAFLIGAIIPARKRMGRTYLLWL